MYVHTHTFKIPLETSSRLCFLDTAGPVTHWVKVRQTVGGTLPTQEELLWSVELQLEVQSKLGEG